MTQHLISVKDLSRDEVDFIFSLTCRVKSNPGVYADKLKGKTLGLIFEKPSTRTWASFQAGMTELGGDSLYFGPQDIAMGKREEVRDIGRVLSSYLSAFVLRTFSDKTIREFARYSTKPVINGLSDLAHPCQALTDLYTILEKSGGWPGPIQSSRHPRPEQIGLPNISNLKVAYVGDGNNVLNSLLFLFAKMGLTLHYATPRDFAPKPALVKQVRTIAKKTGARISGSFNAKQAVKGAHVIYTDVWVSMGEESMAAEKKKYFAPYQVNMKLLKGASRDVQVMHCLPAHRGEEITNQVMESRHSLIFQQAANRMPVQKAILLYLLTDLGSGLKRA